MQQVDPSQLLPGSGVNVQQLTGTTFFPNLISGPFMHGLQIAFGASIIMLLIAAGASLMRGERFVHADAGGAAADGRGIGDVEAADVEAAEHHVGIGRAMAQEGDALSVPALLDDEKTVSRS
jgi:hypothetical protein